MVFHNTIVQNVSNGDYENDSWRARHGYKEVHMHDPAARRNRDFKPVPYGTFKGMVNYRHSEPYCLLKNMKDITREDHHMPIKWATAAVKGSAVGSILGYMYFVGSPTKPFEMNKLMAASGQRAFSG